MNRKWRCSVIQEDVIGAKIIAIRTSDNILDEKDWPVHILKFHGNGVCARQTVENEGVYRMDDFVGKNLSDLVGWADCDLIGSAEGPSHDLCVLICF